MIGTFDALAEFSSEENESKTNEMLDNTSTIDLSSVINRLNELQKTVDGLVAEKEKRAIENTVLTPAEQVETNVTEMVESEDI